MTDGDTVDYSSAPVTRGVRVDLRITTAQKTLGAGTDTIRDVESVIGTSFNDTLIGSNGDNQLIGGLGSDSLDGGDGNDSLYVRFEDLGGDTMNGGNGNDLLWAGNGADLLNGGAGNDQIYVGGGADTISGGLGFDRFIFQNTTDSNAAAIDRIIDFNGAEDLIVLEPLFFVINSQNTQFIGSNAFSMSGVPEIRVTSSAGTQLVEVDTTGNGGADMVIQVVGTALALDDFLFTGGGILV
ncbi:MAG TPA: M10 family metallopeptidase C-terminal domain-containing protein [Accumulibacter sp.]|nr:M10 family metallopeptidase C-terminal domain-containing protein [Accumulibacter sp.]HMW17877.1 M10 family metallopeptidase C-terminal domain-containing protein [Accumulibacter sp.]HNC17968.1 M10 family metallopeptidase C-terminal domain-containing protein [Accumulibacter sp.]HNE13128.1 M10 family metallopeptidase C-terminal domain-containing protein [Accumulibacter sp.]HNK00767.1 M10 family metallopeptidase C-terminal domain-containing protein [Accumulibacter sp.]